MAETKTYNLVAHYRAFEEQRHERNCKTCGWSATH
jgi:hypothetical protein